MNVIKYSPKFLNLKLNDEDAHHLLVGFIRENGNQYISYSVMFRILIFWNSINTVKLLQLIRNFEPKIDTFKEENNQIELAKLICTFIIKKCQYKFVINLGHSLSVHIYPFSGKYKYNASMNIIKKQDGSTWKAMIKNIKIKFEIYKGNSYQDECLKKKKGSHIRMYLTAGTLLEGIIHIDMHSALKEYLSLSIVTWNQDQIIRDGYAMSQIFLDKHKSLDIY